MKRLAALLLFLWPCAAAAQTTCSSTLTQTAVLSSFADSSTQGITARNLRDYVCSAAAGGVLFTILNVTGPATFSGATSFSNTVNFTGLTTFSSLAAFTAGIAPNTVTASSTTVTSVTTTTMSASSNIGILGNVSIGTYAPVSPQPLVVHPATNVNTLFEASAGSLFWNHVNDANTGYIPLLINGSAITLQTSLNTGVTLINGIQIGTPTGGDKGAGTANVASLYYANGTAGVTCAAGATSAATLAVTNGIVTHC